MLKPGWLKRQAESAEAAVQEWPGWLRRVRGLEPSSGSELTGSTFAERRGSSGEPSDPTIPLSELAAEQ